MITINAVVTETESDLEIMSPAAIKNGNHLNLPRHDMCYLSPFSIVIRNERTISESNLSSSGYSSMASPAASRCGSSNPLYPHDIDDAGPSGQQSKLHKMITMRRSSSHGKESTYSMFCNDISEQEEEIRHQASDSETFSDDMPAESNDEGIGTDHIEEKIEGGQIRSAKELENYIEKELLDSGRKILSEDSHTMSQLQLPTIVIQQDGVEKSMSPVSSRSESPIRYSVWCSSLFFCFSNVVKQTKAVTHNNHKQLSRFFRIFFPRSYLLFFYVLVHSERTGMNRFSPQFYNRKEQMLPFTDSDGLYDFPSSDGRGNSSSKIQHSKKSSVKRRDRKLSRAASKSFYQKQFCSSKNCKVNLCFFFFKQFL